MKNLLIPMTSTRKPPSVTPSLSASKLFLVGALIYAFGGMLNGENVSLPKQNSSPLVNKAKNAITTFSPRSDSPIARGQHPRLFLTPSTLPAFRTKVSTLRANTGLLEDYQKVVDYADSVFDRSWEDAERHKGLLADYHALIHLVGPIPGIAYKHTMQEYKTRAIEILMEGIKAPLNLGGQYNHNARKEIPWLVAKAYDWIYPELSKSQRSAIVNYLADSGLATLPTIFNQEGRIKALWSTQIFAARYPWTYGLAIYGDGIRDTDATKLVNSFEQAMLNGGWLDAQNFAARNKTGTSSEMGSYGLWNPWRFVMTLRQWHTATGINYFVEGTGLTDADFLRYYPKSIPYFMSPLEHNVFLKWGQAGAGRTINGGTTSDILQWLGMLEPYDKAMDGLRRWILDDLGIDGVNTPMEGRQLDFILMADRKSAPKSPTDLGLPLTAYMRGVSLVFMRTGFENPDDMAFVVGAPEYMLSGHTWTTKGGGIRSGAPLGFSIDKYGPLTFRKVSAMRGYTHGQRHNVMRFNLPGPIPADDLYGGLDKSSSGKVRNMKDYNPSSHWFRGGITKLETYDDTGGEYDYVFTKITKNYVPERVASYTRQYVYLRPDNVYDRDYIVIFDRTETTRADMVKRWEMVMAYDPTINARGRQMTITNDVGKDPYSGKDHGGHGKLFVKTLLPKQVAYKKFGGPGHEYEDDAGYWDPKEQKTDLNALKGAGAFYSGAYHVDVVATQNNSKENFLHVLQTADTRNADQSGQMVKTTLIEAETANMQGGFIEGSRGQENAVVLFAKEERLLASQEALIYTVSGTGNTRHVIVDLPANISYEIWDNGRRITTQTTKDIRTDAGIDHADVASGRLYFKTKLNGTHTFKIIPVGGNVLPTIETINVVNTTSSESPFEVELSAKSNDADGSVVSYSWNLGDGSTAQGSTLKHTYRSAGTYTIKLTVTDNDGNKNSTETTIEVTDSSSNPAPPIADFTVEIIHAGALPVKVKFDASSSRDDDGHIVSYNWNFGDGTIGSGITTTHTYNITGVYNISLAVSDDDGATASTNRMMDFRAPTRDDTLLIHYTFDNNADDQSGHGYHGIVNGAQPKPGIGGQGYKFDGIDDYIAVSDLYFDKVGAIQKTTICAWINSTYHGQAYNDNWGLLDFDGSEYFTFYVRGNDGKLGFSTADSTGLRNNASGTAIVNDGKWHFACAVYDGNDKILYVDGAEDSRTENPHNGRALGTGATRYGFVGDGSKASNFDGERTDSYYQGYVDELRIYSRALGQTEISALFDEHKSTQSVSSTVYEDAEDNTISGWYSYSEGLVKNIDGGVGGSQRAIEITGDAKRDVFRLGKNNGSDWDNDKEFLLEFSLVLDEPSSGIIYVQLETTLGIKYLIYGEGEAIQSNNPDFIYVGLGNIADSQWHTVLRNLQADLSSAITDAHLLAVKGLFVYGSLKLDDIVLRGHEADLID